MEVSFDVDRWRKKPVVIWAVRLTDDNLEGVFDWLADEGSDPSLDTSLPDVVLEIRTPEGVMEARPGDWVIQGVKGEFYPVRDDIFRATYEPVD